MRKKLKPADLLVKRFGLGVNGTSRALGYSSSTVGKWLERERIPNTDGKVHPNILKVAKEKGVRISLDEIENGGYANGAEK